MRNRLFGILAIAATIATLAAPLAAQSARLTATIPFEFSVSGKTMPAGDYSLNTDELSSVLRVASTASSALTLTRPVARGEQAHAGQIVLIFNQYGSHYVLSQVWTGLGRSSRQVPETTAERELAKTATLQKHEIRALLARR